MKLRKIFAHGALASLVNEPLEFAAYDLSDARGALTSAYPEVQSFLWRHPEFAVVLSGKDKANARPVEPLFAHAPFGDDVDEIHLVPAAQGAGVEELAAIFIEWGMSETVATIA